MILLTKARLLAPILCIVVMLLPAGQMVFHWVNDLPIREHVPVLGPAPEPSWQTFRSGNLQRWVDAYVGRNIGFRSHMLTLFNEINFRVFPEQPNLNYVRNGVMGFFPTNTVARLNDDVVNRDYYTPLVSIAARRLSVAQRILAKRGVTLVVALAPAKVRLYPEYLDDRYFVLPSGRMLDAALSYGALLEREGVNTLDFQHSLLELKKAGVPLFSPTGFHWNFYAGCLAADAILQQASAASGRVFPGIDCSDTVVKPSSGPDTDILVMMNIFSTSKLASVSPMPVTIRPKYSRDAVNPKVLIVGDSFSDQINYSFLRVLGPSNIVFFDYFQVRKAFGPELSVTSADPFTSDEGLNELLNQDLVVVVESDGNIRRDNPNQAEYGVTTLLLTKLLPKTSLREPLTVATPEAFIEGWDAVSDGFVAAVATARFAFRGEPTGNGVRIKVFWRKANAGVALPHGIEIAANGMGVASLVSGERLEEGLPMEFIIPTRAYDPVMTEVKLMAEGGSALNVLVERIEVIGH